MKHIFIKEPSHATLRSLTLTPAPRGFGQHGVYGSLRSPTETTE